MLDAIRKVPALATSHPEVVGQFSRLAFVPTLAGPLVPANRLYDPRVTGLRDLLDLQTAFPAPPFDSDDEVLLSQITLPNYFNSSPAVPSGPF